MSLGSVRVDSHRKGVSGPRQTGCWRPVKSDRSIGSSRCAASFHWLTGSDPYPKYRQIPYPRHPCCSWNQPYESALTVTFSYCFKGRLSFWVKVSDFIECCWLFHAGAWQNWAACSVFQIAIFGCLSWC